MVQGGVQPCFPEASGLAGVMRPSERDVVGWECLMGDLQKWQSPSTYALVLSNGGRGGDIPSLPRNVLGPERQAGCSDHL